MPGFVFGVIQVFGAGFSCGFICFCFASFCVGVFSSFYFWSGSGFCAGLLHWVLFLKWYRVVMQVYSFCFVGFYMSGFAFL